MKQIVGAIRRTKFGAVAALFLLVSVLVALPDQKANAAGLLYRSLELSSSAPSGDPDTGSGGEAAAPGSAANGSKVTYSFVFQPRSSYDLDAIQFQFCTGPFGYLDFAPDNTGTCTLPTGLAFVEGSTWDIDVFESTGGAWPNITYEATGQAYDFNADGTDPTKAFHITPTAGAGNGTTVTATEFIKVVFTADADNYFVNPTTTGTFFAHIETYDDASNVAAGTHTDEGTVASSTATTIAISTRVQETLKFSVEGEDNAGAGVSVAEGASCAALTGTGAINMGDTNNSNSLSTSQSYDAYSYFRLATNSSKGAQVLYAGQTLKSTAGDEIDALTTTATASSFGTEQFGLAVSTDNAGNDVESAINSNPGTDNDLIYASPYGDGLEGNTANNANGDYAFDTTSNTDPKPIATSGGVVKCDTGVVRYIANISNDTPAGLYSTKISYIAVPSY
jgi:hypothetical protein